MRQSDIVATLKVARSTVQWTLKTKNGGKLLEYNSTSRKKTKLTPRVAAGLRRRIKCAPTKSLRQVAAKAGQNRELVRRLVKLYGWRSLKRTKVPLISEAGRKKAKIGPAACSIASKNGAIQAEPSSFRTKRTLWWIRPSVHKMTDISAFTTILTKKRKTDPINTKTTKTAAAAETAGTFQGPQNMLLERCPPYVVPLQALSGVYTSNLFNDLDF